MPKLFDYVSDASFDKKDIWDDATSEKEYVPYMINRAFSYYVDSIMDANAMNMLSELSPKEQYTYYLTALPKRKRFSKWFKLEQDDLVEAVQFFYKVNPVKARQMITLMMEDEKKHCLEWHKENNKK